MALVIAMAMVLGMTSMAAFAEDHAKTDDDHTLTITPTNTETDHSYDVYQIFKGVLEGDHDTAVTTSPVQLNSLAWGNDTAGAALIDALKDDETIGADFADATDAPTVAAVLSGYGDDSAKLQAFADVVSENLTGFPKKTGTAVAGQAVEIAGLNDGWYFIMDTAASQDGDSGSYSKYMLKIVGDTEITAKDTKPTLEKKIKEGANKVDASNGSIGDKVDYEVTSKVPDMTYYDSYKFEIVDTMSKGLTFNDDVAVAITGVSGINRVYKGADGFFYATEAEATAQDESTRVTKGYTVTETTNGSTGVKTINIYFVNFIQYKDKKNADITVTYSATINQDALVVTADQNDGNSNKARLEYSNNPNDSGKGTNGEPDSENPSGKTPDDEVKTYTTGLELYKYDADTNAALAGAVFNLTGDSKNVVITNKKIYVKDAEGTYWKLKDGTWTTDDPNEYKTAGDASSGYKYDRDLYEDTTNKYKEVSVVDKTYNSTSLTSEAFAASNGSGFVEYTGLGEGLYEIEETKAPTGYNKLTKKIYVYITFDATTGTFTTYKYKGSSETVTAPAGTPDASDWDTLSTEGAHSTSKVEYDIDIPNQSGAELPSTGGIGTTIFYVVGAILVIGAGVIMITRRRMDA